MHVQFVLLLGLFVLPCFATADEPTWFGNGWCPAASSSSLAISARVCSSTLEYVVCSADNL